MNLNTRKPLSSVDEYRLLKTSASERCGKLQTNCYIGASGLESLVTDGRVEYEERDEGLLLFIDEGAYARVYYFIGEDLPFPAIEYDRPLVIEEIDSRGRRKDYIESLFERLQEQGWGLLAHNIQVSEKFDQGAGELPELLADACSRLEGMDMRMEDCPRSLAEDVGCMWRDLLRTTDIPGDHFGFADDPAQKVVCVVDSAGKLCGANWWTIGNGVCEIRHTVVHDDCRHRGLGYAMLLAALVDATENGCREAFTYIDDANYKSIGLYEKAGVVPNGKTSTQFVLRKD